MFMTTLSSTSLQVIAAFFHTSIEANAHIFLHKTTKFMHKLCYKSSKSKLDNKANDFLTTQCTARKCAKVQFCPTHS